MCCTQWHLLLKPFESNLFRNMHWNFELMKDRSTERTKNTFWHCCKHEFIHTSYTLQASPPPHHTYKKENQIFLIYKEIQSRAAATSYLIYVEMRKYFSIYEDWGVRQSYMTLQLLNSEYPYSLYMRKIFFSFLSVQRQEWVTGLGCETKTGFGRCQNPY